MSKLPFDKPRVPLIDLATLRETLAYIRDDLKRVPGFDRASAAVGEALLEIERAERARRPISEAIISARFLRRRPH